MLSRILLSLSVLVASASAQCCAFGGDGSAVMEGMGTLNPFPKGDPRSQTILAPMIMGVSASPISPFVSVVFGPITSSDDSIAGWMITPAATPGKQVMYAWQNLTSLGYPPVCTVGEGEDFVAGFAFCAGAPATLFPSFDHTYSIGGSLQVNVFTTFQNASAVGLTKDTCVPVSLTGFNNPMGTGAFAMNVESGAATVPPPAWSSPPSYCGAPPTVATRK